MMGDRGDLIAVVGLSFEARIAAGPGIRVICNSGAGEGLERSLTHAIRDGARGVVSFGVAGGLRPDLAPGTCIIGSAVVSETEHRPRMNRISTHAEWAQNLLRAMPGAIYGALFGSRAPVAHTRTKAELYERTGAVAVDMESHIVGAVAAAHGLPMAAIRVVTDPAERALPPTALAAMRSDGTVDLVAMVRSLLRRPQDLPALMQIALDAKAARQTLLRGRALLGASLGVVETSARPAEGFAISRQPA
jgi:adenosylhomocysteine nucleosidase